MEVNEAVAALANASADLHETLPAKSETARRQAAGTRYISLLHPERHAATIAAVKAASAEDAADDPVTENARKLDRAVRRILRNYGLLD